MGDLVKLLRVGVAGAAGLLGRELLEVLDGSKLPVVELVPIGSEASVGEGVEFRGEDLALHPPGAELKGLDLLFLCAPADESLELARRALHARVPCLDLSGALASSEDVPLLDADDESAALEAGLQAPLVSVAGGPALAWARVLRALDAEAGLAHVQVTGLESASTAGHRAFAALSTETTSLLNQQEAPEQEGLPWPLAFDCHAATDDADLAGQSGREAELAYALARLLGSSLEGAMSRARSRGVGEVLLGKCVSVRASPPHAGGVRHRGTDTGSSGRCLVALGISRSTDRGL